jgi:hypothetical protein
MSSTFRQFEILVVDKGSAYNILELVRRYPSSYIVEGRGLVAAYNAGWTNARGEIVALVDDDITPGATWLEEIVRTYDIDECIGAVGGPQALMKSQYTEEFSAAEDALTLVSDTLSLNKTEGLRSFVAKIFVAVTLGKQPFVQGKVYGSGHITGFVLQANGKPTEVDYVNVNMTFRKEALVGVGGFDENYNVGHGDYSEPDVCLEIKKRGWKVFYNPRALVFHEASGLGVPRGFYERARNFMYFYWKWHNELSDNFADWLRFVLLLALRLAFWTYWRMKTGDKRYSGCLRGAVDGMRVVLSRRRLTQ